MGKQFVSVLIDTYNHERFIEQAIVSVLEQDFPASEREILVVDDGSTDRTPEIVRKFEPEVRLLRKENGGQASAFNAGIPECKGEVIAFLDGDDWWMPRKLSRVALAFAANPQAGIVGHGIVTVFSNGTEQTEVLREGYRVSLDSVAGARLFRMRRNFLGGSRCAVRSRILQRLLPVPAEIRIEADEFVFTMAAALGEVEILPEALFFYRIHETNLYSQQGFDEARVRLKYESITQLADSLAVRLRELGLNDDIVDTVVSAVRVEADQLRLSLNGGAPWEAVKTELAMYNLLHSDASWAHRSFKYATLWPAYFLSPRVYYGVRRWLAARGWYRAARKVLFPAPQPQHITRSWKAGV